MRRWISAHKVLEFVSMAIRNIVCDFHSQGLTLI